MKIKTMLRCFLSFLVVVVEDHVGCVSLTENPSYSTFSLFFYIFFAIKRTNPVHSFHFYDLFHSRGTPLDLQHHHHFAIASETQPECNGAGDMSSPYNSNWIFDCGLLDDIGVSGGDLPSLDPPEVLWSSSTSNPPLSAEFDDSFGNLDSSRKRVRSGSCSASGSKACREKMRRDRLNDRSTELASILDPGRPPKMDKTVLLVDAVRMVTQLRDEAQKLKLSNENLVGKINELKFEKNELRDEKQRLKNEKENLERQAKDLSSQPAFLAHPPPVPAPFSAPGQVVGGKLVPLVGYPGVSMWQFMPPAAVDTSQDHVLRPPVA